MSKNGIEEPTRSKGKGKERDIRHVWMEKKDREESKVWAFRQRLVGKANVGREDTGGTESHRLR